MPPRAAPAPEPARLHALVDAALVLSGTLELDAVLNRMVRIGCRVVGARFGALGVLNPERKGLERFVFHGISAAEARRIGDLPRGRGILGALVTDARPLRLDDIAADARSVGFPPGHPPMRTFLGVPVMSRGKVFGNLYLTEKRGGVPFTAQDEELAVALARQAGVAVENARLYAETRASAEEAGRRVRELTSLQEIGAALLGELDPARVLRMVAERARELTRAHAATIAMQTEDGTRLRIETAVGAGARALRGIEFPIEESMSGETVVRALGARSAMFALLVDRAKAVGTLGVAHRAPGRFDDRDRSLLEAFANLASQAFRNARLFAEERERSRAEAELAASEVREQLKGDLLGRVIRAQEDERRRISRDLHDSTGQALASVLLGLKVAEQERTVPEIRARIADLREVTAAAVAEMRRLAQELRPPILDDMGLPAAIERYAADFEDRTGVRTRIRIAPGAARLSPELETVLYRVVQESLANVAKHASASNVRIELTSNGVVKLRIRDDGIGFVPDEQKRGLGLAGMRERVALVDGKLDIRSAPGLGTTVTVEVARK